MSDRGMNMKPGINYCAPVNRIGFRGISSGVARLIPLPEVPNRSEEMFFFHGVDIPATALPYVPDMGPDSPFEKSGCWHYYEITRGIFIVHLRPTEPQHFECNHVLQMIVLKDEAGPRVFLDRRETLLEETILTRVDLQEIEKILKAKQLVFA